MCSSSSFVEAVESVAVEAVAVEAVESVFVEAVDCWKLLCAQKRALALLKLLNHLLLKLLIVVGYYVL